MTNYKATPEQWENMKDCAADNFDDGYAACILELRAKVEALESNSLLPDSDISKPCPNSSQIGRPLVERVAIAISQCEDSSCWDDEAVNWTPEARAAIREVAAWMRENKVGYNAVRWIEQEIDR